MDNVDEVDPAAEFIAREQSVLAEIENEVDVNGEVEAPPVNGKVNSEDINELTNHTNNIDYKNEVNLKPEVEKAEPEKIIKWREEQQKLLHKKDEEEEKRKQELREQGKKELEEWYSRYREQLDKSKAINRNAEKEWIAERDAESTGQEWEKIAKMCDFNPKAARNLKDTSRMRSILLQLKQGVQ